MKSIFRCACTLVCCVFFVTGMWSCSQKGDGPQAQDAGDPFALTPATDGASTAPDLKVNLPVSAVYRYKVSQQEELMQDDSMSVSSVTTSYYTKTVTANRNGLVTFTVRYDSISETQSGKGMGQDNKTVTYNSTNPANRNDPKYVMVNKLIGEPVNITVNANGKIEEISGLSGIINAISASTSKPLSDTARLQLAEQVKQVYFAQLVSQEQLSFPESPVDSTMSWSKNVQQQMPPVFLASTVMTYKIGARGTRGGSSVARIDAGLIGSIGLALPKIPVTISKGLISGKGTTLIDIKTGHTIRKTASIRQELTASAQNPSTKKTDTVKQVKVSSLTVELL